MATVDSSSGVAEEAARKSKRERKRDKAAKRELKQQKKKEQKKGREAEDQWINDIDRNNANFEKYYREQTLFNNEEEWGDFLSILKEDLPTTFRVTGSRATATNINEVIKTVHVPSLQDIEYDGQKISAPTQLPWYPGGLAWAINVHKTTIRRVAEFKKLQNFLVYEAEVGGISRQEAVSMIPPLVLDVEPHHKVLDMCAAPGSKTAQILEALHIDDVRSSASIPPGLVIANDSDYKRAGLLVHQSSRLPSPALIVTNVDAAIYPHIKVGNAREKAGTPHLLFDRILADVPCSGDGTLRKNPIIWRNWHALNGNGLHGLQLRILLRAMNMLAPGGRIVYSTCSMNPVENEAVVAAALNHSGGTYHLVDVSDRLPELIRAPGLSKWRVTAEKEVNMQTSYEELLSVLSEQQKATSKIVSTMFPPADVGKLHLERCWRIYPHQQNTGGFFVAVLERVPKPKTSGTKRPKEDDDECRQTKKPKLGEEAVVRPRLDPIVVEHAGERAMVQAGDQAHTVLVEMAENGDEAEKELKARPSGSYKEEPYTFLDPDSDDLKNCLENIRVNSSFPSQNLFVRNAQSKTLRAIYLSNSIVKSVLTANEPSRLRFISAGIKIIGRQDSGQSGKAQANQKFRVLNDGVSSVLPYLRDEDILKADLTALKMFLQQAYPVVRGFAEPFKSALESRQFGHQMLRIEPSICGGAALHQPLTFPIWKSGVTASLMLDKKGKSALSLRLFGVNLIAPAQKVADNKEAEGEDAQADEEELDAEGPASNE